MKKLLCFTLLIFFLAGIAPTRALAGWTDDWLTNSTRTSSGPGFFEGQKRGYFYGGSYSQRWPSTSDSLMSFEPPHFNAGCGGIDLFLGGFTFLDFDHLVQKLQNIMSNAAAYAFKMGLSTLCPMCDSIVGYLESASDFLNSSQLNDCAAGQAAGSWLVNNVSNYETSSGGGSLYYDEKQDIDANNGRPTSTQVASTMAGCNEDFLKTVWSGTVPGTFRDTSLLKSIGTQMGIDDDYINLMRGLLGDLVITGPQAGFKVIPVVPCSGKNDVNALISGNVQLKRPRGGSTSEFECVAIDDASANLTEYVHSTLDSIGAKLSTGVGTLTADEIDLIEMSPLPIHNILSSASMIGSGMVTTVTNDLSRQLAVMISMEMFGDLYARAYVSVRKGQEIVLAAGEAKAAADPEQCQVREGVKDIIAEMQRLEDRTRNMLVDLRNSYDTALQEYVGILQELKAFEDMRSHIAEKVSERFNGSLMKRALSGR